MSQTRLRCLRFCYYNGDVVFVHDMEKPHPNETATIPIKERESRHSAALKYVNETIPAWEVVAVTYHHHDIEIWFVGE